LKIDRILAYRLSLPFFEETVVPFVKHRVMNSVVVRVFAGDYEGVGETSTSIEFSGENADTIMVALHHLAPRVLGADPREFRRIHELMDGVFGNSSAKAGIDIACYDLAGIAYGVPVATLLGGAVHERVRTQHLLPIKPLDEIVSYARKFSDEGYRIFEMKIEANPKADLERIAAIRGAVAPDTVLVIDANRTSTVPDAVRFVSSLDPGNDYLEQPVDSIRQMVEVRRHSRIPLVADELSKSFADAVNVIESGAADALSIKLVKVGGFYPASQIASYAEAVGVPFRVDDMCMSRLGNSASYAFATAWKGIFGCGFAQHTLLVKHDQIVPMGVDIREGWGSMPLRPGVGATIDYAALGAPAAEWKL